MGHYFGLLHTFEGGSCTETNCASQGDRVCDTEPHPNTRSNDATCNETIECGTREPTENLMNYSGPTCGNIFTMGQANRMQAFIRQFLPEVPNQPTCISSSTSEAEMISNILAVYPNPYIEEINISNRSEGSYILYGSDGRQVKTFMLPEGAHTVDLSDLPTGIYTLLFQSGDHSQTKRIIHQNERR